VGSGRSIKMAGRDSPRRAKEAVAPRARQEPPAHRRLAHHSRRRQPRAGARQTGERRLGPGVSRPARCDFALAGLAGSL